MKIAADYLQTLTILFRAGGGVLQTVLHTPFVIFMRALVLDARQADLRFICFHLRLCFWISIEHKTNVIKLIKAEQLID